jgi:hypothetical protein
MRKVLIAATLLFISTFFSRAQAATRFEGTLALRGSQALSVTGSHGEALTLNNGPIELVYQSPGLTGFVSLFTGHRQVLVNQGAQPLVIDLASSDFNSFGAFRTPVQQGQSIMLVGGSQQTVVRVEQRASKQSCTYSGYCMACSPGIGFDGKLTTDCSFKYNLSCSGSEATRAEFTDYTVSDSVSVIDSASNAVLGVITRDPIPNTSEKTLSVTGSCG